MSAVHIVPPCREDIAILHADRDLLLVNKPAGLLSVPGRHPANRDCLIHRIQRDWPDARVVHRLDLDTSGVMVLALNAVVHRDLSRQFEQRRVEKCYEAVVAGLVSRDSGTIELPLRCDWPNRPRQIVDRVQGKPATTHFEVLAWDQRWSRTRLRLTPETGRSHQLRVHLAEIGHPVVGCVFYAPQAVRLARERLLLHATRLGLQHPGTGEWLTVASVPPF